MTMTTGAPFSFLADGVMARLRSRVSVAVLATAIVLGPVAGADFGGSAALAQDGSLFAPRVRINGAVVTNFEVQQRALFLRALRLPGDPEKEALRLLIEDRLGAQAAKAEGVVLTETEISDGMTEFASRANLSAEEFIKALAEADVAPETFRDFVSSGLLWRALIRKKFPGSATVTDSQIDRAIAMTVEPPLIRVLMSELFIPIEGDNADAALEEALAIRDDIVAGRLSFGAAARQYSAAPTGQNGGRLDWLDLTSLPGTVAEKLLKLAPGDVADPFVLPNAVALFQLNNLSEGKGPAPAAVQVEYAQYLLAPGEDLAAVRARVDRCVDLNIVARGLPADRLTVTKSLTSALPQDVAIELAKLDVNEASATLRRGASTVFLMLCQRQALATAPEPAPGTPEAEAEAAAPEAPDDGLPEGMVAPLRAAVREQLGSRRLEQVALNYMEELRSEAIISQE